MIVGVGTNDLTNFVTSNWLVYNVGRGILVCFRSDGPTNSIGTERAKGPSDDVASILGSKQKREKHW